MTEQEIEQELIEKLSNLKYTYRPDIRDRAALEQNFREKFEALNRVNLNDSEFHRLLEQIITSDIFADARATCANATASSAMTVLRSTTPWSISRTGVRTASR